MRYFIFFYKCENNFYHNSGMYGTRTELLPSNTFVSEQIAKFEPDYTESQVNIVGFSEVAKADYDSFFDKTKQEQHNDN